MHAVFKVPCIHIHTMLTYALCSKISIHRSIKVTHNVIISYPVNETFISSLTAGKLLLINGFILFALSIVLGIHLI